SSNGPALAARNGRVFIAWRGEDDHLNIAFSDDSGRSFRGKHVSNETSDDQPTLAFHNELPFIAWKGSSNDHLNVARVAVSGGPLGDPNFKIEGLVDKQILGDTTSSAPSLLSSGGVLFIAWKGSGNDNLNVGQMTGFDI